MKFILPSIVAAAGILVGTFGGNILRGSPAEDVAQVSDEETHGSGESDKKDEHGSDKDDGHGGMEEKGEKEKGKKDKKGSGGHGSDGSSGDVSYFKFSREFVVPIMSDGSVRALVILHIQLEVDSEIASSLFSMEPKLRDNIMATLIEISHDGKLFDNLTDPEAYESIRALVLEGLREVKSEGIENILIVDLARQDL